MYWLSNMIMKSPPPFPFSFLHQHLHILHSCLLLLNTVTALLIKVWVYMLLVSNTCSKLNNFFFSFLKPILLFPGANYYLPSTPLFLCSYQEFNIRSSSRILWHVSTTLDVPSASSHWGSSPGTVRPVLSRLETRVLGPLHSPQGFCELCGHTASPSFYTLRYGKNASHSQS